jgi:uncharacterized repeat protein (TIGR02543 family)
MKLKFTLFFFLFVLCLHAQQLTISSTGQSGTSGTNWSLASNVLTVTGNADVNVSVINSQLASNNLTLSGASTIYVYAPIYWNSNTVLTLSASQNIFISNDITAEGSTPGLNIYYGGSSLSTAPNAAYKYAMSQRNRNKINFSSTSAQLRIGNESYTICSNLNELSLVMDTATSSTRVALSSDINLNQTYSNSLFPITFSGKFDGLGHEINGLKIRNSGGTSVKSNLGLFSQLQGATIMNLGITNVDIRTNSTTAGTSGTEFRIGSLAGNIGNSSLTTSGYSASAYTTTIESVWSSGNIGTANNFSTDSQSLGDRQKFFFGGGLIGSVNNGTANISRCYSYTNVSTSGSYTDNISIGGLIGDIGKNINLPTPHTQGTNTDMLVSLSKSFSTGSVLSGNYGAYYGTGGIVGVLFVSGSTVSDCYSWGSAISVGSFGGLIGFASGGSILRSYTTQSTAGSITGATRTNIYTSVTSVSPTSGTTLPSGFSDLVWTKASGELPVLLDLETPPNILYVRVTSGQSSPCGNVSISYTITNASGTAVNLSSLGLGAPSGTPVFTINNETPPGTYSAVSYLSGLQLTGVNAGSYTLNPYPSSTSSHTITGSCSNYQITFNGNNNTSGTVPAAIVFNGSTVLPSQGDLLRSGYQFIGWNTAANGTGTNYESGATYDVASNVTLYANWLNLASLGNVTIVTSGGDAENSTWKYANNVIYTSSFNAANINASEVIAKMAFGDLTIVGSNITVNADVNNSSNSNGLTLKTIGNILQAVGADISTNGGDVTYWSDSDASGRGAICIGNSTGSASISTNGGDIILSGGSNLATGYAASSLGFLPWGAKPYSGVSIFNSQLNAQGGHIKIRGALNSQLGSVSARAVMLVGGNVTTNGSGTITVNGTVTDFVGTNPWAVLLESGSVVQTATGAITMTGTGNSNKANTRGFAISGSNIQSLGGSISLTDTTTFTSSKEINYTGVFIAASSQFGKGNLASSSSNITITADKFQFDTTANNYTTSGIVTFEPYLTTFKNTFDTSGLVFGNQVGGLTIGKDTNAGFIVIGTGSVIDIAGPIRFLNSSWIRINATTKTADNVYIKCTEQVEQTAPILANELHLISGFYDLTNSSNNVSKIIGGSATTRVGYINYSDVDDLEIGTVNSDGIFSWSTILVETENGNITLSKSVNTTSNSSDAIILNAGKSSDIGTGSGGDIIVNGAPTITTGANGIAKLFSGTSGNSTGLTHLVGGETNVRYDVDETTTTFVPALQAGNVYAFYRASGTVPPTVSSNQSFCEGARVSDLVATGTNLKWYDVAEGGYPFGVNHRLSSGTYYVSQSVANLESDRVPVEVTLLPRLTTISAISGTTTLASDATTAIYSVTPVSGATHYVWNLPSGLTLTDQTGPSVTVAVASSFTSGSISVYAYNDCNATIVKDLTVTKATILPGGVAYNITGNPIICANGSQTYTSTYVDNGVYTWTVPSGITITSGEGTNVITVSAGANFVSGRIQSTCVVSGVTFNASYTVAGVAQPSTIAGPVNLCPINSATYSVTDVPGVTYVWQVPSGMSITSGSGTASINVAINSTSINGDISVRAQTECGLSSPTYLKVSSTPIVGRIFGATRVCGAVETILDANGNIVGNNPLNEYTYNIREIAGATSYTWTVPSGATIVSGQGTNSIVVSYNLSTFGSGNITVRGVNSCGSGIIRSITVSAVTGSISGPTDLCSLNSATYSVPADLGTGFVWTLPDGMSITSGAGTSSINVVLTHPIDFSNINTVSVQFDTACGATKTLTLAVKCNDYTTIRSCGQVINFTDRVYPYDVQGATGYAFDIYEADGTTFITTIENSYSFFRFTQINFTLGATYQVRVRVKRGSVYSVAGTACSVTISNSIPTTTIEASQCGATINYLDRVYPIGVSSATGYAFDIYAADGSTFIRTIENSYSFFRFTQMDFVFGNTYQVRVRVKQGSNYGLAGAACSITIDGALPTTTLETAQCGALINYTDRVYPIGVLGATGYAFDIYGSDGVTFIVTVENTYSFFRFTQINYVLGEKYYVKVRVKRGDQYGDQGAACLVQLNDPNARMVIDEIEEPVTLFTKTDLKAYPNPFTSTFQITPIEGETATMFYQVYDVTGKMIESRSVEANEIAQHVIGDYYPAGMYIVIVNQGAIKQTFKMVKH